MNKYKCILITLINETNCELIKCAIRVHQDLLTDYTLDYWKEVSHRNHIRALLPDHVKADCEIVAIEEIFEVVDYNSQPERNEK